MKKMNFRKFLLALALPLMAVGFVACDNNGNNDDVDIKVKHGTVTGDQVTVIFPAEGKTETVTITATHEWAIKNEASIPSWITVAPKTNGKGTKDVSITVTANDGTHNDFTIEFYLKKYTGMVASVVVKQNQGGAQETNIKALNDRITTEKVAAGNYKMKAIVVTDLAKGNYVNGALSIMTEGATAAGNGILLYGEYTTVAAEKLSFFDENDNPLYAAGDEIEIELSTLFLQSYRGTGAQADDPYCNELIVPKGTNPADFITKTGRTATLNPVTVTYDQLEDFQNMYVQIEQVQSLSNTITEWASGSTPFTYRDDLSTEFPVYIAHTSEIVNEAFTTKNGTIKGVAYVYAGSSSARSAAQLVPRAITELAGLTNDRVVGETKTFVVTPNTAQTVPGNAGTMTFTVNANVAWTVESTDDTNFGVAPANGTGAETVILTYTQNPSTTATRDATITFTTTDTGIPAADRTVAVLVTQSEYVAAGNNLLLNPSFETLEGNFPASWTNAGAAWEVVTTGAQEGTNAVKMMGDADNRCDVKQTINGIEPGKTYIVSFWYKDNTKSGTTSGIRLWANFVGTSEKPAGLQPTTTLDPVTQWTEYRVEVVAPAGSTGFNFEVRATKNYGGTIDNCTFAEKED